MDVNKEDVLLFFKLFIFGYIIISPFISNSWFKFINYNPVKIAILITIVILSFFDLQLAILLMVAFLVILINLNKDEVMGLSNRVSQSRIPTMEKEQMIRGQSIFPIPSDIFQPPSSMTISESSDISQFSQNLKIEKFQNELGARPLPELPPPGVGGPSSQDPEFSSFRRNYDDSKDVAFLREETNVRQTISSFPKPYCEGIEYDPILISEGISKYELDYHTKPFEEYVRSLTPEMAKQII